MDPELLSAAVDNALPALRTGGVLVLLDALLDGAPRGSGPDGPSDRGRPRRRGPPARAGGRRHRLDLAAAAGCGHDSHHPALNGAIVPLVNSITDFYHSVTDVEHIVSSFGLIGIALVLFAETGLLIGFFAGRLPALRRRTVHRGGDNPVFPLWQLLAVAVVFAVIGDQTGYQIGRWAGPPILRSRAARLIGEERIGKAQDFFATRGPHAVILARFVPVIRTIVPVLAGISGMERRRFIPYNIIGGVAWACIIPVAGYFLGGVDFIRAHVDLIIILLSHCR